jgi:hypothetical protein
MAGTGKRRERYSEAEVAAKLDALGTLPRATLVDRWTAAYGGPPPRGLSRRLLEYSAAWHIQARAWGGLSPAAERALRRYADSPRSGARTTSPPRPRNTLQPGSRLIREWQGRTCTVDVLDNGFLWDGRRYRSLSEIARAITGTRWSGPRFFGL